jgi:hypothetical protein
VPKYSLDDGGPYITPGIVVSKDPETGVPDIGHYRFEIIDKQTMSFNALPNHRLGKNIAKARAMGHSKFHAAVVIGVDPLLAYTSPIQVPDDTNDWEVAAGLRGALVELVHAKTVDLDVAARAEVVIEFVADFSREVMEGPLGEYTGFYTPAAPKPIARVTAITHRNGAIFQALLTGDPVLGRRVVPHRHGDEAALRRRGAQRFARRDRHQPAAQDSDRRRSRYRRAQFPSGRMGDGLPHAAVPRRDRGRRPAGPLDPSIDDSIPL